MRLNKINAKLAILLGLSLLLMPFANALTVNDFFQNFYGLVENQYAFYTIMFLVTFIFLFSIFFALSKNIPFFKGSGGNVGPAGQIFALSLSAIATLSLFSYVQGRGGAGYASGFFTNRVGSWGPWGWILLALLILAVVFFALRKHGKGILGEGDFDANLKKLTALLWVLSFILVMYGSISKNRTITTIGAVLFVIALILTVLTGGFKFGKEGEPEPPHPPPVPPEPPEGYGTIYGVVSDRVTGREIPHVRIECAGYAPVIADIRGNYSITVPIGQHVLAAAKQGYNDYRSNPIAVASRQRIEHNFEMEPIGGEKGTIEGKVVVLSEFQQGREVGIEGATVKLLTQGPDRYYLLPIDPQISDANGKFTFKDLTLPRDKIVVYAEKEGRINVHMRDGGRPTEPFDLDQDHKEQKDVVVVLDIPVPPTQMGYIEGKVVYKDERGNEIGVVKDAIVRLYDWNTKQPSPNINPKNSDENGKFKFENLPLPMMQIAVYVEKEGSENVHWRNGRPSGPINLTITPDHKKEEDVLVALNAPRIQTGFIEGRVLNFDEHQQGREVGVDKAEVYLEKRQGTFLNIITFSDEDGNFKFENLQLPMSDILVVTYKDYLDGSRGSSNHMIEEGKPDHYINLTINRPEEKGVVIYLEGPLQTSKISGNIVNAFDMTPIPNSTAMLTNEENRVLQTKDSTNGHFEFDVQFGKYYVMGEADNYEHGRNDYGGYPRGIIEIKPENPNQANVVVPLRTKGPVPPRGAAAFDLIIGGKSIQEKTVDTTDLVTNNEATFTIRNSGSGGVLRWKAAATKGLSLSKTEGSLAKDQFVAVTVNVTDRNVPYIPHVTLVAYAGGEKEVRPMFRLKRAKVIIRYQVVSERTKELKKKVQEVKKKTAQVEKTIKKDVADKKLKLSIKWDDESLEDLKIIIEDIENRIKLIKTWNRQVYSKYIEENTHFQGSLDFIKKIYIAKIKKKQLRSYERYTYQDIFRIADRISVFLDELVNYCEKHRTIK